MMIQTERLRMRPWTSSDAEAFHALYQDERVVRYLGRTTVTTSIENAQERLDAFVPRYKTWGGQGYFFSALSDADGICGAILLKPIPWSASIPEGRPLDIEIGWHLSPRVWGRGYATEAARAVLPHAWSLGLERIVAVAFPENAASLRVMERLGMSPVGLTSDYYDSEVFLYELFRPQS